jgi:hypothetical protein
MNKTLFTNGCSWTYGGGLDQPDTREHITHLQDNIVWPAHVQRLMNFDEKVSLAVGGGSNQRICRTTFDWVTKQTPETLKNTTAIIQWTCVNRYEYYVPKNNEKQTILPGLVEDIHPNIMVNENTFSIHSNGKTLDRWARVNPSGVITYFEDETDREVNNVGRNRYRTYTGQEGIMTWLTQLGFLHDLLNHYEVEHYFWQFCEFIKGFDPYICSYMYKRFPFLEETRDHLWEYQRIRDIDPMKKPAGRNSAGDQMKISNDPHPSELGHEQLAEYIVEAIAKKKTILRKS